MRPARVELATPCLEAVALSSSSRCTVKKLTRCMIFHIFHGLIFVAVEYVRRFISIALVRPREFFSPLIFHHFPIETLPKNVKCRRSSALDLTSRTLPRFRCRFDSDRPLHNSLQPTQQLHYSPYFLRRPKASHTLADSKLVRLPPKKLVKCRF